MGRVNDKLSADLALARIALGVWRARSGVERRVAELRSLLARIEIDAPKRRALEAFLDEDLGRLADAPRTFARQNTPKATSQIRRVTITLDDLVHPGL